MVGELYYGAHKSNQASNNLHRIEDFVAINTILACDAVTAFHYGSIKDKLRQKGKPIHENDIWIAALSVQFDLTLVSRDDHFKQVQDLNSRVVVSQADIQFRNLWYHNLPEQI